MITPPGLEKYSEEVAEALKAGPLTWKLKQEIACHYGQEFLEHVKHWGQ